MHEKENFVFDGGFSMIKKNDLFEAEITAMTAEGSGSSARRTRNTS